VRFSGSLSAFRRSLRRAFREDDVTDAAARRRFRWWTPGALLAVALWLAASAAFAVYVSMFGSYNKAWGSLTAVIVMLTWIWLSSLAFLLGAELNAELEGKREHPIE